MKNKMYVILEIDFLSGHVETNCSSIHKDLLEKIAIEKQRSLRNNEIKIFTVSECEYVDYNTAK